MKTEILQELLTSGKDHKEIIDEIMRLNGEDIKNTRETFKVDNSKYVDISKYNELLAEKDKISNDFINVNNDFSAYKESTKDYASIKEKYNGLLKESEFNNKIAVLNGLNCKHSDLLVDKLDWAKYDQEKKTFDDEYINGVKSKYSDLFDVQDKNYVPNVNPGTAGVVNSHKPNELSMEDLRKL